MTISCDSDNLVCHLLKHLLAIKSTIKLYLLSQSLTLRGGCKVDARWHCLKTIKPIGAYRPKASVIIREINWTASCGWYRVLWLTIKRKCCQNPGYCQCCDLLELSTTSCYVHWHIAVVGSRYVAEKSRYLFRVVDCVFVIVNSILHLCVPLYSHIKLLVFRYLLWRIVAVVWGTVRLKPNERNIVYKGARNAKLLFESAENARARTFKTISNIFASNLFEGCAFEKVCLGTIASVGKQGGSLVARSQSLIERSGESE